MDDTYTLLMLNFGYPIPSGRADVMRVVGREVLIINVDNLRIRQDTATVTTQVRERVEAAVRSAVGKTALEPLTDVDFGAIDIIGLPGLSILAVLVVLEFLSHGATPNILRVAPVSIRCGNMGKMDYEFVAVEKLDVLDTAVAGLLRAYS